MEQVGSDVVVDGSGSFNIAGVTVFCCDFDPPGITLGIGFLAVASDTGGHNFDFFNPSLGQPISDPRCAAYPNQDKW
jgi:hypothetical protein